MWLCCSCLHWNFLLVYPRCQGIIPLPHTRRWTLPGGHAVGLGRSPRPRGGEMNNPHCSALGQLRRRHRAWSCQCSCLHWREKLFLIEAGELYPLLATQPRAKNCIPSWPTQPRANAVVGPESASSNLLKSFGQPMTLTSPGWPAQLRDTHYITQWVHQGTATRRVASTTAQLRGCCP